MCVTEWIWSFLKSWVTTTVWTFLCTTEGIRWVTVPLWGDCQVTDRAALTSCSGCAQLKARDVAAQALGFVQNLVSALLNFHSYTEQRVHIYPLDSSIEAISPVNQKVQTHDLIGWIKSQLISGFINLWCSDHIALSTAWQKKTSQSVFSFYASCVVGWIN